MPMLSVAQTADTLTDNASGRTIHKIEIEALPSVVLHTNEYLRGINSERRTMNHAFSARLKYAFQAAPSSLEAKIYKGTYQGVGVAYHDFNPQLSNPISIFIYQGSKIASIAKRISFNYEWNLGLTFGWKPYDHDTNPENRVIGSRVTAYIDADFYFNWMISRWLDLNVGLSLTHFSNGNTKFPNAGLNILGSKVGFAYYIHRDISTPVANHHVVPPFQRHICYNLVMYGAWRRRGVYSDDGQRAYALPGAYGVCGFNFNPMYNINHWLNAGVSLDGVYDHSANLKVKEQIIPLGHNEYYGTFIAPSLSKQIALGFSGRAEFVMPYFTINVGIGTNFINGKKDFKGIYELLALKLNMTRNMFLHIGYSLNDFKDPNHLMLGLGYRFHNKRSIR